MTKKEYTVKEIIEFLKNENENETIEGKLLRRKLIRELYKKVGKPKEEDFPDEFKFRRYWDKVDGYTTFISVLTEENMKRRNRETTEWNIQRASETKENIVKDYTNAGWHCRVQAYNVMCTKYVKHPKYENLWVEFYCSRDCSKYELVISED